MKKKNNTTPPTEQELAPVIDINTQKVIPQYKQDEWVYFAFNLSQIKAVGESGEVVEVSDGNQSVTAPKGENFNAAILPLTPTNKAASELMQNYVRGLQERGQFIRINLVELLPIFVGHWKVLAENWGNKEKEQETAKILNEFLAQVDKVIADVRAIKVGEIPLFK